jgi:hypothetical protein
LLELAERPQERQPREHEDQKVTRPRIATQAERAFYLSNLKS